MTWDDFTKKVKEFFTGKKVADSVDTSPYDEGEKELVDKLGQLDEEYKNSDKYDPGKGYEDISDLLPEKQTFEYLKYEGDDEDTIRSNTKDKYDSLLEDEKKKVDDDLNTKTAVVENKKQSTDEEYSQKQQQIDKDYDEFQKALEQELVKKGLYRSSIKQGQTNANEQARAWESNELASKRNIDIGSLDAEIARLQGDANSAIQQLDLSYAKKLDSEIERLIDKRNKEIQSIDKYNNTLKEKETKYIEDRAKAIEAQLAQRLKDELAIKNMEDKYGYAGAKKENYQKRYNMAYEYYSALPQDAALQMLQKNKQLEEYLGAYYGKLITEIAKSKK
ncbi:MAG: hypothetical protein K2L61_03375 [Clostridia bacterium]|nr:hypothetical protein [Clostridia bacterium]